MILNAENLKCIHFVYILVYIIYTAMYTLCTFSCIHFVCITSVRGDYILVAYMKSYSYLWTISYDVIILISYSVG